MFQESRLLLSNVIYREGHQALHPNYNDRGVVLSRKVIHELIQQDMQLGTNIVEFGAPVRSPYAHETITQVAHMVENSSEKTQLAIHCRCTETDVDAALAIPRNQSRKPRRYHLYYGTSPELRRGNGGKSNTQIIEAVLTQSQRIRRFDPHAIVRFSTEDAYRTDITDLAEIIEGINEVVDAIGFPDTTGYATPEQIIATINQLDQIAAAHLAFQFHFHRDRGTAEYSYSKVAQNFPHRVLIFDTSTLTLGERNGIPSPEGIISAFGPENIDLIAVERTPAIQEMNHILLRHLSITAPWTLPLSHANFHTPVSGVHAATEGRSKGAYHVMPNMLRVPIQQVIASAVVGGNTVQQWLTEHGNPEVTVQKAQSIADQIRTHALRNGKITPHQAEKIIKKNLNP